MRASAGRRLKRHAVCRTDDRKQFGRDSAGHRVLAAPGTGGKLDQLFIYARDRGIPLYVMIDEYDNFANTILAQDGADAYRSFTHGSGFYRDFFTTLKAGTRSGGLERLFVTGVSPITMDDVTSGFNGDGLLR